MILKIEILFDEQVRPSLAAHGGNVEIIDLDNDRLFVRLHGGCQGCSSSKLTLKDGIEQLVKKNFPNISEVVDLTDHEQGENPYM
ncbi:MAG: NifU family protein [Bacteriovoracaceae bacterium]|nr:NifU family protein [Bacteriovoracaceae bacterium]